MNQSINISESVKEFIIRSKGQFIDGEWVKCLNGFELPIIEPSSGINIGKLSEADIESVNKAVESSVQAFNPDSEWSNLGPSKRERLLNALATAIEENADQFAELITLELGAPLSATKHFEVNKAVETLRYYAGFPSKIHGDVIDINQDMGDQHFFGYTCKEPVGVVAAIVPWNAPLMIAVWKLAPAIAVGCTVVMKPSEEASLAILRLAELAHEIGFPPGVFNVIVGRGETVGNSLVSHPGINKITFTGSMKIGKEIHKKASDKLIRLSLELGGKSPVIVMPDADLEEAVPGVAMGAFANSGQVCVAGSRVFVHKKIADEFIERIKEFSLGLTVGSGLDEETQIGPVISKKQQQKIESYIDDAWKSGAKLHQKNLSKSNGFFVPPTVITNLPRDSKLLNEEIFGPVMTIEVFEDENDIILQTNSSSHGLAAMVWSESHRNIQILAKKLRVGTVFVNTPAFPPPSIPTGGFRESGIGRDLGASGLEGFLETKSVISKIS